MEEAGPPKGVFNFLPGSGGEEVGDTLRWPSKNKICLIYWFNGSWNSYK